MGFGINGRLVIGKYIAYFPYLINKNAGLSHCYIVFVIIFICGIIAYGNVVGKVSDSRNRKIRY